MNQESIDWVAVEADQHFISLHRDKNRFLRRMMLFALIYFFCLPIATAYFQHIFSIKLWGVINLGLAFALSQFLVAWAVAIIYARKANAEFDARAEAIANKIANTTASKGA